jgi:hypothetical protein
MRPVRPVGVPSLYPDESLNGFLVRLTKNYVFELPQHLLSAMEVDASTIAELHREKDLLISVADRFGLRPEDLTRRRYPLWKRTLSQIQFAGQPIRKSVFSGRSLRLAPHTFRRIGHHRMCWDLAFVIADPDTGERLISACPHCERRFRWIRPDFEYCPDCAEPLAKGGLSRVPEDVRLAISVFSGLLSFDQNIRTAARASLASELRQIPPGHLLQSLYEISNRPISQRKGRGAVPAALDWETGLVRMLQISIGWPEAVLGLIDELTAGGRRKQDKGSAAFKYGRLRKALPAWEAIPQLRGVAIPVARALESSDITLYRPHPRFSCTGDPPAHQPIEPRCLVTPYEWFRMNAEMLSKPMATLAGRTVSDDLADLASLEMIKIRWGLVKATVSELTVAGYLRRADSDFRHLTGSDEPLYRLSEIENFFSVLRDRYEAAPRSTRVIGFTSVLSRIHSKLDRPYVRIIQAVLDGSFRPIRIKEKARTGLESLQFGVERADKWVGEQLVQQHRASYACETASRSESTLEVSKVGSTLGSSNGY